MTKGRRGGDEPPSVGDSLDWATGQVLATSSSPRHGLGKSPREWVELVAGHGVRHDTHAGVTVQHRSRVRRNPSQPNLRQVHLLHAELLDELAAAGFPVGPGALGENVTTRGVDLLALPRGTRLQLGRQAVVEVTGLRNPCRQLDDLADGLRSATVGRDADGRLVRKAGIMSVVVTGGVVRGGDLVRLVAPAPPYEPLDVV